MTARLTRKDYMDLKAGGYLDGATVKGGDNAPRKWSNAKPNTIDGIRFPSKCESRVYLRLCEIFGRDRIRCQVTMPLVAGEPKDNRRPLRLTVDFAVMDGVKVKHWVDAKTNRKNREWLRGKSLFEATWGRIHEWNGISDFPVECCHDPL